MDKEMKAMAKQRYKTNYEFKRGIRPASPERDEYAYKRFKKDDSGIDYFYGYSEPTEVRMATGKAHGFKGARTAVKGHSIYNHGNPPKKGHRIGKGR